MLRRSIYGSLIVLLSTTAGVIPAYGQSNFSNSSGFKSSNMQGYWSDYGSSTSTAGYSSSVIQQSQSILQNLTAARQAYISGANQTEEGIRRYSRRPTPDCNCTRPNPGVVQLEQATQEAKAFLNSIQNPNTELLQVTETKVASPIW